MKQVKLKRWMQSLTLNQCRFTRAHPIDYFGPWKQRNSGDLTNFNCHFSVVFTSAVLSNPQFFLLASTAPEVLNPKIVLWLFLNQFVSDFNSETAGTSKLILIHLDLYENIGHRKMTPPPLPAHPSPGPCTRHSDVTKKIRIRMPKVRETGRQASKYLLFSERRQG